MKIVIIDNDAKTIEKLTKILDPGGEEYELAGCAADGKTGYELIRNERPDLVIMDLALPGMSGLSVLRRLRAEQDAVRVLILTDDTDFEHARNAIDLG